jgi:hypothetical protein
LEQEESLKNVKLFCLLWFVLGIGGASIAFAANPIQVRVNRWLEVRRVSGNVFYQKGATLKPVQIGMRLQAIGEGLQTGKRSATLLALDTGIGFVQVAESTKFTIQQLQTVPDGGHVTYLDVPQGQVRLRLRRFTHSSSRLEVKTPASVSGVRGTDFGVTVQPDGKTGIATLTGSVLTEAQSKSVMVDAGTQSLVLPGQPPSPPIPLKDDSRLAIRVLAAMGGGRVRIAGQTDPVNLLLLGDVPQKIGPEGEFDITVPMVGNRRLRATVITPLGKQQVYELAVP